MNLYCMSHHCESYINPVRTVRSHFFIYHNRPPPLSSSPAVKLRQGLSCTVSLPVRVCSCALSACVFLRSSPPLLPPLVPSYLLCLPVASTPPSLLFKTNTRRNRRWGVLLLVCQPRRPHPHHVRMHSGVCSRTVPCCVHSPVCLSVPLCACCACCVSEGG